MSEITTPLMNFLERVLNVSAQRHELVVTNMANVDTPGYRTQDLDFRAELQRASLPDGNMSLASTHKVSGLVQRPDGNDVSVEREGLLLAETQMQFGLGIQLMQREFHNLLFAINEGNKSS